MPITNSASGIGPGAITYFPVATAPAGWLKCNGAAVSRTAYAALFLVIGTTYGVGDGATTFNLPDLRGEFLRVLDEGRGVDAGRTLGSVQAPELGSHKHVSGYATFTSHPPRYGIALGLPGVTSADTDAAMNSNAHDSGAYTSGAGGSETRPRNVAMPAYIKY